jgi:hypothetical protein
VYDLGERLAAVHDERKAPRTAAPLVAGAVLFTGLLRIRSFNALEPKLSEKPFLRLVGAPGKRDRLCSADTLSRALRVMDVGSLRRLSVGIVAQAERNKVFREGWYWTLRYVALDGWEPFRSFSRHCEECLVRHIKMKSRRGEEREVEQYYHRFAVAMLIDKRFDLALDIEPVLPQDRRIALVGEGERDEGELTAGKRLLRRVKGTFPWLDVVVGDSLYANGPFLTLVKELRMGAVVIARKEGDEPLKEALRLWGDEEPHQVVEQGDERVELWDCEDLTTLDTYKGSIRVVRGRVTDMKRPEATRREWCMGVTGCAERLPPDKVLAVGRGRWHIENTGFHQWSTRWRFTHVFTHDAQGIRALYWLFFAAYNLLTLFLYLQLKSYGRDRGRDVTRTISRLVDEMHDDLARLDVPLWDSS